MTSVNFRLFCCFSYRHGAATTATLSHAFGMLPFWCRERSKREEELGIRRYLQIEIHEAVNDDRETPRQGT